ncbi:MAG: dihydrolipoamide acetyltransferase component of pyruvate dehydrogenase complex [Microbacteriaceae bacterium]|nr:dihydrolipoamide acetyltransferase component of pyruvate dehydrogenase complex [Microbacteriaceae bacterium]
MTVKEFALPDLGEGLTESELVAWRVAVGDVVELNQIIAEVETAKALVELPSPFAGTIAELFAEPGATVAVGAPIASFDVADGDVPDVGAPSVEEHDPVEAPRDAPVALEREPVLVGYGPPVEGGARPKRRARTFSDAAPSTAAPESLGESVPALGTPEAPREQPRSTPPVRKLARERGVDLATIVGTGEDGLVTREDLEQADVRPAGLEQPGPMQAEHAGAGTSTRPRETRTPIRGVRKHTAAAMVSSAFTAPHASEFLTIDVTPTMELIEKLRGGREFATVRVGLLAVVAKALCIAVARTPSVNSRWDDDAQEIVEYGYVNLGIAAATPRGLVVPNVKDADRMSLLELARALGELVDAARDGTSSPAVLTGGTISITNIGSFGIDAGTPILNPGEALILAIGAVRRMPWEFRGDIALRQVMTLSISFDHRLIDGEQASRFITDVAAILSDPGMLLTMV